MAKTKSLSERFGNKGKAEVEVVEVEKEEMVEEETQNLKGKSRKDLVKREEKMAVSVMETARDLNPEFDLGSSFSGNTIKMDGEEFVIRVGGSDDAPEIVTEFDCLLLGSQTATSWYDPASNYLYVSFDGNMAQDGVTEVRDLIEKFGKGQFRVQLTLGLEGFEEPFQFLTSGTAFYKLREYAAFLADATKPKGKRKVSLAVNEVVTHIEAVKIRGSKGTFYAPEFTFSRVVTEDE